MDWSMELRAAKGDKAAIDEMLMRFDIETFTAPGGERQVLI